MEYVSKRNPWITLVYNANENPVLLEFYKLSHWCQKIFEAWLIDQNLRSQFIYHIEYWTRYSHALTVAIDRQVETISNAGLIVYI